MCAMRVAGATTPRRDYSTPRQYSLTASDRVRVEICVESVAGVRAAARAGADRAELCSHLVVGGTTPSIGAVEAAVIAAAEQVEARRATLGPHWADRPEGAPFGLQVMVRPRGGSFVFDDDEGRAMVADVRRIAHLADELANYTRPVRTCQAGVELPPAVEVGFVIGALNEDGTVDRGLTRLLAASADGAPVTFHKAIDAVPDIRAAYRSLRGLGVHRVLTAGGTTSDAPAGRGGNALDGLGTLADLVRLSEQDGGPLVIAAGGVRADNAARVLDATGTRDIHLRCSLPGLSPEEPQRTDEDAVAQIVALVRDRA